MVIFKIVFALLFAKIGQMSGNHPAAPLIIGGFFGHLVDQIALKKFLTWRYVSEHKRKAKVHAEETFIFYLFSILGIISQADGPLTEAEKNKLDQIGKEVLKLNKRDYKKAFSYALKGPLLKAPIQSLAIKLVEVLGNNRDSLMNVILSLKDLASVDRGMSSVSYNHIFTIATIFGFGPEETKRILDSTNNSKQKSSTQDQNKTNKTNTSNTNIEKLDPLSESLAVLGCKKTDSDESIRRNYRELVSKFHPDKIVSKELPQDFIDFATSKFSSIQAAYETVRKLKGF